MSPVRKLPTKYVVTLIVLHPKPPARPAGRPPPEVELVQPRVPLDADDRVLEACIDVPRLERPLEPRPPPHLAFDPVRPDHDLRAHVVQAPHPLEAGSDDATVLLEEPHRGRPDPDLCPRLRGELREVAVEQVPLEDVTA